jgi:hypothetical protein
MSLCEQHCEFERRRVHGNGERTLIAQLPSIDTDPNIRHFGALVANRRRANTSIRRASRWAVGSKRRSIYCQYMRHNCSKERAMHELLVRAQQSFVSATDSS